jgi:hypothetical protein
MRFELLLCRRMIEDVGSRVLDRIFGPKRDRKILLNDVGMDK